MADLRAQIASKVAKAEQFLLLADVAVGSECWDAGCSLVASAAISASDALIMAAGGLIPSREEHARAAKTLSDLTDASMGRQLHTALKTKSKSQYDSARCSQKEAEEGLKAATRLVERAKKVYQNE